jgi:hypothetical protein
LCPANPFALAPAFAFSRYSSAVTCRNRVTSHAERAFLSVRQELKRYARKTLGYSKDLETHKVAVALHFGIYNFLRTHKTLGTTPAVAAGVELERWDLEDAVEMTADYFRRKEDAKFEEAFAALEC